MNGQPKALRLAEWLECGPCRAGDTAVAAELRRLHELNQKLEQENTKLWGWYHDAEQHIAVLQGRAKAKEQA